MVGKKGLLEKDVMLNLALMDMHSKCGILDKGREIFDRLKFSYSVMELP